MKPLYCPLEGKDEENRYFARSLQDAEEYYEYRCCVVEQGIGNGNRLGRTADEYRYAF
jgi:hypothetical protein